MLDEGAKMGRKGARTVRKRGIMRMGWSRKQVMLMGGATDATGTVK